MMEYIETETRNSSLPDLVEMLQKQSDVRYDIVVPSSDLEFKAGNLTVKGGGVRMTEDGVHTDNVRLAPTAIFDEGLAKRFNIPLKYVKTLRERVAVDVLEADPTWVPTLYDENMNYWLDADKSKQHLVRGFRTDDTDSIGIARAFLSNKYKTIDNYDVLMATLDGVKQAGVQIEIDGADLSDKRMSLRLVCPQVKEYAPEILKGYRSPFTGETGADNPTVFAGLVIKNSETGNGAFTIVPRLFVQVCSNGLQVTKDAMRAVHLGEKLDEGIIRWSDDTQRRELDLITSKTRDAVATFLDVDYMQTKIIELKSLAEADVVNAPKTIQRVAKKTHWSEDEQESILRHFIQGGDTSALGIAQAVTSVAQTVKSPDRQDELETSAIVAAELAIV